jgi:hypothetical protein
MYINNIGCGFVCPHTRSGYNETDTLRQNSKWMEQHYDLIQDIRLSDLIFPGSHDSGTYAIKKGDIRADWKKTQNVNITVQLELGMRFIDLRPGGDGGETEEVYIWHYPMRCEKLVDVVAQVAKFIEENPQEIIMIKAEKEMPLNLRQTQFLVETLNSLVPEKIIYDKDTVIFCF